MTRAALLLLASFAAGCTDGSAVTVDVRSDLVPARELAQVEVELYVARPEGVEPFERVIFTVTEGLDLITGEQAASFSGVPDGARWLIVRAVDSDGRVLLEQPAALQVAGPTGRTVTLDRQCRGVECPGVGGSPGDLACLAGRCVDPECSPANPAACPEWALCERDADCIPPGASCATSQCRDAVCFATVTGGACHPGQWCDPNEGCSDMNGVALDAGPPEDACVEQFCDAGSECMYAVRACGSSECVVRGHVDEGEPCGAGGACDGEGECVEP